MRYEHVTTPKQLNQLCERLADASSIAFDTEFVSENTYRPELCLVQVAAGSILAVIDPQAIGDVTQFWERLSAGDHETIVHAGREELRFCLHATGRRPTSLVDVQIAAGLVGMEYPAAYGTLIHRLLEESLDKGETRTDWRRRPLSERQINYALQDVVYLEEMRKRLDDRLGRLGRRKWLAAEMEAWQAEVEDYTSQERWQRVSGSTGLSARALAIMRELWRWREQQAEQKNRPPKRILRDDLLVELARRGTSDVKRIRAVRGLDRRDLQRHLPELARRIASAQALPSGDCPRTVRRPNSPQLNVVGQFLATALGGICRQAEIAPSLVGTVQDVRDLVAYRLRLDGAPTEPPSLAQGWRAEVVGCRMDDLLAGKLAVRVADPMSSEPLVFEEM